jgi:hypothetical protein
MHSTEITMKFLLLSIVALSMGFSAPIQLTTKAAACKCESCKCTDCAKCCADGKCCCCK